MSKTKEIKPYFKNKEIILWNCDFLKSNLPEGSIDLVVTSPRYNAGIDYGENVNDMSFPEDYIQEMVSSLIECWRILKPGGHIAWITPLYINENRKRNGKETPENEWNWGSSYKTHLYWSKITTAIESSMINLDDPLWLVGVIPWIKPAGVKRAFVTKVGSISNKPHPINTWEIVTCWRKGHQNRNKKTGIIPNKEFITLMSQEWRIQPETRTASVRHPVPYPVKLIENILKVFTIEEDVVLDPFMGSGTSGIASLNLNRKFVGIDINEDYVKNAMRRIGVQYSELNW